MIEINGVWWQLKLVAPHDPVLYRRDGSQSVAACDNTSRTIYISNILSGTFLKKVIIHEITHAVLFSYNIKLPVYQEEIAADIIATYGNEINYIAEEVFNILRGNSYF